MTAGQPPPDALGARNFGLADTGTSKVAITMNTAWAIGELQTFIARCQEHTGAWNANRQGAHRDPAVRAMHDDVIGRMPIVEQIAQES
jgi:hypothetical protein